MYYEWNYKKFNFMSNENIHIIFFVASVNAMYFFLVNNKKIVDYFLGYQLIKLLFNKKIISKIDF